jgi:hypothetical protein
MIHSGKEGVYNVRTISSESNESKAGSYVDDTGVAEQRYAAGDASPLLGRLPDLR